LQIRTILGLQDSRIPAESLSMQALQFHQTGSLDYLQLLDLPVPLVRPGFAVVEVGAAGINPSDVKKMPSIMEK
jgi:D-arabinose 1-dehydrogenase-like Zn-dependent alcohol dehydrogenase